MKYSIIFAAAAVASEVYPTTIKDYDHKDCTVTAAEQSVLVYHTAYTITHTESSKYGGYAQPTGAYPAAPSGCWYEKYEKQEYAPYNKLGPHAWPGYKGIDDCEAAKTEQPVEVREYKNGKWNTYSTTHTYKAPSAVTTTYSKAGTYTIPSGDCTVDATSYYAAEATKSYSAGETCTYGGKYVDAQQTGYLTVPYAEYDNKGKPTLKTKTVYASSTGKVEVCKPTTTSYPQATTVHYPVASWYNPGVYHYPEQTVKAETDNHAYTCTYEQVKDFQYKTVTEHPAYPTATPVKPEEYKPAYPQKPAEETDCEESAYPTATGYPAKATPYYANGNYTKPYPTGYAPAKPVEGEKYPTKPVSDEEDCDEEKPTDSETKKPYDSKYPTKPTDSETKPGYPPKPSEAEKYPTPAKPVDSAQTSDCEEGPEGETKKPYPAAYPQKPSEDTKKPYEAKPVDSEQKYPQTPSSDEHKPYPATPSSDDKTKYPAAPSSDDKTKYPAGPSSDTKKPYPAKPVADEDCEEDKPVDDKTKGYKAHPRAFAL